MERLAEISVKKGESISSNTTVVTLVTKQKMAEISLNEVDIALTSVGQKTIVSFDAIDDLTITGKVEEIAVVGSVTQGVVNYGIKIIFDTQDTRVKPGMSMSVSIITEMKQGVIIAPNSAIKNQGNQQYVQILEGDTPQNVFVETGISNDLYTEIINGLKEGAQVITGQKTVLSSTKSSNADSGNDGRPSGGMNMMMIR